MTAELLNIVLGLTGFLLFVFIQSLIINGIKSSMEEGMILSGYSKWLKNNVNEFWRKPLGDCIKCMSSVLGGITFWGVVLIFLGWHWQEIPVFVGDIFCLVTLNWWVYKRL